jgi:hypothetical protein
MIARLSILAALAIQLVALPSTLQCQMPSGVAPGRGVFVLQFGSTQPQHLKIRAWVSASPAFRDHLAWLSANLALPQDIPVVFASCGVINAFYSPATRTITFCYEWIENRADQVRAKLSRATEEAVTDAVVRSTTFVINHEAGHALVHQLALPVLGREEDAADGFGAFILLERGGPQDAYSVLQGAQSFGQFSLFENMADEHSLSDQRYYNLLCWMLGSDQSRFAGYAQRGGLPVSRQQRCPSEWAQMRASWTRVLAANLRPSTVNAAMSGAGQNFPPVTLVDGNRFRIEAGQYWSQGFTISSPQCRVNLNVIAIAGGQLDVETQIFEKPSFISWQSGVTSAEPVFKSGRVRQTALDVPIRGPGEFIVVVSNKFSLLTAKDVQATIRVACP